VPEMTVRNTLCRPNCAVYHSVDSRQLAKCKSAKWFSTKRRATPLFLLLDADVMHQSLEQKNRRHDIQHNDMQHNDIQHNDIQHMMQSITIKI
jgi:hypothetical protein